MISTTHEHGQTPIETIALLALSLSPLGEQRVSRQRRERETFLFNCGLTVFNQGRLIL
jgi:hypothetical protein